MSSPEACPSKRSKKVVDEFKMDFQFDEKYF